MASRQVDRTAPGRVSSAVSRASRAFGKEHALSRPPDPPRRPRSTAILFLATLALLGGSLYLNTIDSALVQDDRTLLLGNELMHDAGAVGRIVTGRYWGNVQNNPHYRPLTVWTIALNHDLNRALGLPGEHVAVYHVLNALLHAAVTCAAGCFFLHLGCPPWGAWVGAAIFGAMPIHTEAVAAVTGRAEPLALLAGLGFLLAHRARRSPLLGGILFFLALMSKESAIAFLPLVAWMDICFPRDAARRRAMAYGVYAAAAALWLALRTYALRGGSDPVTFLDNPLSSAGALQRILTGARVQLEYLQREIVPVGLSSDYSYDQIPLVTSPLHASVLLFAFLSAAAITLAWRCRRRDPVVTFAIGGYALLAFPTSNFALPIVTIMAERLAYGPSLFVALCAGVGLARLRPRAPRAVSVAVAALLVVYAGAAIARNSSWANEEVFYRVQLRSAPRSAKAWYNRGRYFDSVSEPDSARHHYEGALRIFPTYWAAWNNIGLIHAARGETAAAAEAYRRAIDAWPEYALAHYNLGLLQLRLGEFDTAARSLEAVLRIEPDHAKALANLGGAYYRLGRTEAAVAAWERALRLDPANAIARTNLERVRQR